MTNLEKVLGAALVTAAGVYAWTIVKAKKNVKEEEELLADIDEVIELMEETEEA